MASHRKAAIWQRKTIKKKKKAPSPLQDHLEAEKRLYESLKPSK